MYLNEFLNLNEVTVDKDEIQQLIRAIRKEVKLPINLNKWRKSGKSYRLQIFSDHISPHHKGKK